MIDGELKENNFGWHVYSKEKQRILEIKLNSEVEVQIEDEWFKAKILESPRGLYLRARGLRICEHLPARIKEA